MAKEQDVRRARDEMVRARIQHAEKTGGDTSTRSAEKWASEVARRNDRKANDGK